MRTSEARLKECCLWAKNTKRTPDIFQLATSLNEVDNAIWYLLDAYNAVCMGYSYSAEMKSRVEASDSRELAIAYMKAHNKP